MNLVRCARPREEPLPRTWGIVRRRPRSRQRGRGASAVREAWRYTCPESPELPELRDDVRCHRTSIAILSLAALVVLSLAAWAIGRPFDDQVRDGLLAVGASSSEVATVGLVTLAGADATIALGAVAGSLVASALLGPVAIGVLAGHPVHGGTGHLPGRFALVVIAPLVTGVAVRSARPRIAAWTRRAKGSPRSRWPRSSTRAERHRGRAWAGFRAGGQPRLPRRLGAARRDLAPHDAAARRHQRSDVRRHARLRGRRGARRAAVRPACGPGVDENERRQTLRRVDRRPKVAPAATRPGSHSGSGVPGRARRP